MSPYLDVPVLVEIVDARDAASIAVGVVNMADVTGTVTWVTGNHGLKTERAISRLEFEMTLFS